MRQFDLQSGRSAPRQTAGAPRAVKPGRRSHHRTCIRDATHIDIRQTLGFGCTVPQTSTARTTLHRLRPNGPGDQASVRYMALPTARPRTTGAGRFLRWHSQRHRLARHMPDHRRERSADAPPTLGGRSACVRAGRRSVKPTRHLADLRLTGRRRTSGSVRFRLQTGGGSAAITARCQRAARPACARTRRRRSAQITFENRVVCASAAR